MIKANAHMFTLAPTTTGAANSEEILFSHYHQLTFSAKGRGSGSLLNCHST